MKPFGVEQLNVGQSAGDPGAVAGAIQVYAKVSAGVVQLFAQASDGSVYQITPPAAGGGGLVNDPWGPRSVPHPADDEFEGPLAAAWSQIGFSAPLDFGTRPNPYASPVVNAASFENRREPSNLADNSWLRIQPGAGTSGVWKRLDTADFGGAVPANLLMWSRVTFSWPNGQAPSAGDSDIGISFFSESGGGFILASHATMMVSAGPDWGPAGTIQPLFVVRNDTTGVQTIISQGARQNEAVTNVAAYPFFSGYVAVQKIADTYFGWLIDDGGRLFMGEALPVGGGGDGPNNVNAVAIWCSVAGAVIPGIMLYEFDFVRFYEGADWIP